MLGGSQGGCVFRQDCWSTRRHLLVPLKCCTLKVKHGWSKEDSPAEMSGCPSSEWGRQQALGKSLLGNTCTEQQTPNLGLEQGYLGKDGDAHGKSLESKLASL